MEGALSLGYPCTVVNLCHPNRPSSHTSGVLVEGAQGLSRARRPDLGPRPRKSFLGSQSLLHLHLTLTLTLTLTAPTELPVLPWPCAQRRGVQSRAVFCRNAQSDMGVWCSGGALPMKYISLNGVCLRSERTIPSGGAPTSVYVTVSMDEEPHYRSWLGSSVCACVHVPRWGRATLLTRVP